LGRESAFSSQTHQTSTFGYYRNYCIDSNQILQLHSDKYHQILVVGGRNIHEKNPRWWTAAILKKIEKLPYLSSGLTDQHEINFV